MKWLNYSAVWTVVGILLLFSFSVVITLFAPQYVDPSWTNPSSDYQVQMYEVADPNIYIARASATPTALQYVYHLHNNQTLLAFHESNTLRLTAPKELEGYITRLGERPLKLTSRLLLLREARDAETVQKKLQDAWIEGHPGYQEEGLTVPRYSLLELYDPQLESAYALAETDGVSEPWVDADYTIDGEAGGSGHLYVANPLEYRITRYPMGREEVWEYDPRGEPIDEIEALGFLSRQELIRLGEHIFAIEGCWYCHTDQSRTLVEDSVLNGNESFPAPPSSANEYIYQNVTFPGTRRIGPDLARVGVKRPSRDWHMSHFWSPKTESPGSIMPAFNHFFDADPRGMAKNPYGVPNYRFEAIFQYLMTKGTRITAPTEAWWLGKDPTNTMAIIEGCYDDRARR